MVFYAEKKQLGKLCFRQDQLHLTDLSPLLFAHQGADASHTACLITKLLSHSWGRLLSVRSVTSLYDGVWSPMFSRAGQGQDSHLQKRFPWGFRAFVHTLHFFSPFRCAETDVVCQVLQWPWKQKPIVVCKQNLRWWGRSPQKSHHQSYFHSALFPTAEGQPLSCNDQFWLKPERRVSKDRQKAFHRSCDLLAGEIGQWRWLVLADSVFFGLHLFASSGTSSGVTRVFPQAQPYGREQLLDLAHEPAETGLSLGL